MAFPPGEIIALVVMFSSLPLVVGGLRICPADRGCDICYRRLFHLFRSLMGSLSTKQKYAVGGLFALGVLVRGTSFARMVVVLQSQHSNDMTVDSAPLATSVTDRG